MAGLYKVSVDTLVTDLRTGDGRQLYRHAEAAAVARVTGTLFNLPEAIKNAERELEGRKAQMEKMKTAAEDYNDKAREIPQTIGTSYADHLARQKAAVQQQLGGK